MDERGLDLGAGSMTWLGNYVREVKQGSRDRGFEGKRLMVLRGRKEGHAVTSECAIKAETTGVRMGSKERAIARGGGDGKVWI